MKYYLVNQGDTYKKEYSGGYLWAPKNIEGKTIVRHWENMMLVEKGDLIFNNVAGEIKSFCIAQGECYDFAKPFEEDKWQKEGKRIDAKYIDLKNPFLYKKFIDRLLETQGTSGAFNKSKNANQGYLYPLTQGQYEIFLEAIEIENLPSEITLENEKKANEDLLDIIEEEKQFKEINENLNDIYTDEELLEKEKQEKKSSKRNRNSNRVDTDKKLKSTRLEKANYLCEINHNHKTFTNCSRTHQYLECHHLISLNAYDDFPFELDVISNLLAICPICHAQVHYGSREAKEEMFYKMYDLRKKELGKKGIKKSDIDVIFNKYYF